MTAYFPQVKGSSKTVLCSLGSEAPKYCISLTPFFPVSLLPLKIPEITKKLCCYCFNTYGSDSDLEFVNNASPNLKILRHFIMRTRNIIVEWALRPAGLENLAVIAWHPKK